MNEFILIELHIDATALTPDEQALIGVFRELSAEQLVQCLLVLHHWQQAHSSRKAIALKLLNDRLTDKDVAHICRLSDRQLRRYREYQSFARQMRRQQRKLPRGSKDRNGQLEAWDTDDDTDD